MIFFEATRSWQIAMRSLFSTLAPAVYHWRDSQVIPSPVPGARASHRELARRGVGCARPQGVLRIIPRPHRFFSRFFQGAFLSCEKFSSFGFAHVPLRPQNEKNRWAEVWDHRYGQALLVSLITSTQEVDPSGLALRLRAALFPRFHRGALQPLISTRVLPPRVIQCLFRDRKMTYIRGAILREVNGLVRSRSTAQSYDPGSRSAFPCKDSRGGNRELGRSAPVGGPGKAQSQLAGAQCLC